MNVTATDVLGALFNPTDTVCFRVFEDKKTGVFRGAKLSCECGKYKSIEETLKNHNAMQRGIFFVVNYGGQDDAAITRINAQFFEMDDGTFEEQQKKVDAFPLLPSMVIKTQKSLHVYYFMDSTAKVERFREIQKRLVKQFGGDPVCVNESRVMRLPGFQHCKKETPVEVTCISFHPERKYTQEQLASVLPEVEGAPAERRNGTAKGLEQVCRSCDFIKHCRENASTLSEHDWYAMITNLAPFDGGTARIHEMSQPYPRYSEADTQRKINHFLESGTKPMTCRTIAEKGFKCSKAGKCSVKSPAALCFQPMEIHVLLELLQGLPVTGEPVKDLQTAKAFMLDYLYNQDMVTADAMIQSNIRDHFKLPPTFLKSLQTAFKTENKAFRKKMEARKARALKSLPEWYEVIDAGVRFLPGVLAKALAKNEKVFYAAEQHFRYQGGVYVEMAEMEAQRLVQEQMLIRETKMSQIVDAEKQWRLLVQRDIRELNANPYIINVRNGLYNILEDTLTEHTPDYFSTVQLDVAYDKAAGCPLFKKFLAESMGGDMEQVGLIQEMLGYFLIPVNSAQKCFVIVGAASAGKSVLLRVLNDVLLGRRNVSNVSWQALNERFKTAELFGKLANIFADLPTKNIDDNGIFKALVGEDYLTVEKKNKNPFSFQSSARLLFSCNSIPKNYGDRSEGFYRRLVILRFKYTVPKEKRDPELLEKFRMEADGIFLFALEGLRRLMGNRYIFSETQVNADELQQYREESDSVLSFVKDCCELSAEHSVGSTELFNAYKGYCEECGLRPYAQKNFVQQITATFSSVTRGVDALGKRRTLIGIKLGECLG
ncbi:phage/plasmid primase, P4 family [uncultured Selenomonas sp.]|uniref:phage/plasmid primase, P4 family n=1 Tax=uncultured Selenomonas sp. TaxID=159275 RepID=UPI0028D589CB|nr:phage/plasmid primase, P4 family [uncultured Selenomonas sp.]